MKKKIDFNIIRDFVKANVDKFYDNEYHSFYLNTPVAGVDFVDTSVGFTYEITNNGVMIISTPQKQNAAVVKYSKADFDFLYDMYDACKEYSEYNEGERARYMAFVNKIARAISDALNA